MLWSASVLRLTALFFQFKIQSLTQSVVIAQPDPIPWYFKYVLRAKKMINWPKSMLCLSGCLEFKCDGATWTMSAALKKGRGTVVFEKIPCSVSCEKSFFQQHVKRSSRFFTSLSIFYAFQIFILYDQEIKTYVTVQKCMIRLCISTQSYHVDSDFLIK